MSRHETRLLPSRASLAEETGVIAQRTRRRLPLSWIEACLLALVFIGYLGAVRHFASDVASGSDPWGYVSEAVRLSHGRFYEAERVLSRFGLPENAGLTFPLAYVPKGLEGTVPTYPFGYPLLMAVAIVFAGMRGAFWVTPLLAAGALLLTYLLGRALLGRAGGAAAASLLAVLPNFLWGAFVPLSDVPATFFVALALVALLALPAGPAADALLGLALGIGFWVRPNLGLLIGVIGAWLVLQREWQRLFRIALAAAPFLLIQGLVNWHLWGAPSRTGYGRIALGDGLVACLERGGRYLLRLNAQQGGAGIALLALALLSNRLTVLRRFVLAGVFGVFVVFFATFRHDNAWWYLRYILPALPAVAVLEAGFLIHFAQPGRLRRVRAAAAAVTVCAVAIGSLRYAQDKGIFATREAERHFTRAAAYVSATVQVPALVLAMQHSGSLRFYTKVGVGRYDLGSPAGLADTLVRVVRAGGNVYIAADAWEIQRIANGERRFLLAGAERLGGVEDLSLYHLNPARVAETLGKGPAPAGSSASEVRFDGAWTRGRDVWRLRGVGTIALPAAAEPALARVCAGGDPLAVRRVGLPDAALAPHLCADLLLLPGASGSLSVATVSDKEVTLPPVPILRPEGLRFREFLASAYILPHVAHLAGRGGVFWQTDLVLVNPQKEPLRVTGFFLPTGRSNTDACAASGEIGPGAVASLRDILGRSEFAWAGRRGSMLLVAGSPGKPCATGECGFLAYSRTYNVVGDPDSPGVADWLAALPFSAGMASGRAEFRNVAGGPGARLMLGVASWTNRPVHVRVRWRTTSGIESVREEDVPTFGHLEVDLGAWPDGGMVQVEVVGSPPRAGLFPYLSTVHADAGEVQDSFPDWVSAHADGSFQLPVVLSSDLRRDL